jgi:hypothetical protein
MGVFALTAHTARQPQHVRRRHMTSYDTQIRSSVTRSVTITGTRFTEHFSLESFTELFATYLGRFADWDRFYVGGARGIDTLALDWLREHTTAAITVVVPASVADQPEVAQEAIAKARSTHRAEVVELRAEELNTASYHARNRWMVERSGMTIGFPRGTDPASGTWYTLGFTAEQRSIISGAIHSGGSRGSSPCPIRNSWTGSCPISIRHCRAKRR